MKIHISSGKWQSQVKAMVASSSCRFVRLRLSILTA